MSRPSSTEHLKPGDWERLRESAEQLEQAWHGRTDVDLAGFLPPPEDPLRAAILEELVKTDLEIRRSRGQAVSLDFYQQKYPDLGNAGNLSARLIYEEYCVLRRFGEPLNLEHYRQRFPDQFAELQQLVAQQSPTPETETHCDSPSGFGRFPAITILQDGDILPIGEGYRLIQRIGEGSFGEVWQVEAPGGFPAAIKIVRRTLDSEEAKRELRSLEVIKRLSHPHLLKTQAAWPLRDRLIILMELADCTLRDHLYKCKASGAVGIPVAELLRYFQEAAEALDYLHSEKVLHRDVKPQNLLLCRNHVKVADFGLVRDQNQNRRSDSLAGTPGYMAPEAWGCASLAASDQYGLALTYAELRLGRWPFEITAHIMMAHLEGTPDLARLGEAERDVLLRGMAKNPLDRFPTCQAFVTALRDALPGDPSDHDFPSVAEPRSAPATQLMPIVPTRATRHSPSDHPVPATQPLQQFETQGGSLQATCDKPPEPASSQTLAPSADLARVAPAQKPLTPPGPIKPRKEERQSGSHPQRTGISWRKLAASAAVVLFLLVLVGIGVRFFLVKASFELLDPPFERVILSAGSQKSISMGIKPTRWFRQPVKLTASSEEPGLTVNETEIAPGSDNGELTLQVAADAVPGPRRVNVRASTEKHPEQITSFQVVILPSGFEPMDEQPPNRAEMPYPSRIVRRVGERNVEVVFLLIPPQGETGAPFYLMDNKVSNAVFRVFAAAQPQAVLDSSWKEGGVASGHSVGAGDELPVFRVSRLEAQQCAAWLGGLLPTAKQLDQAAGYTPDDHRSKTVGGPLNTINNAQEGPRKITESEDRSPFGVHDLAGNGREWTRDDLTSKDGRRLAILRGCSYTASKAPSFADLDAWNKKPAMCPVQQPEHRSWTTSFRVVIELPRLLSR